MEGYWDEAKTLLQTLIAYTWEVDKHGSDLKYKTGMDLRFANNPSENELNLQIANATSRIGQAMQRCYPGEPKNRGSGLKSNMETSLKSIFNQYLATRQKRSMTIYVLTDGAWESTATEDGVSSLIAQYRALPNNAGINVQFIHFGDHEKEKSGLEKAVDG
jgi:hypothetical protein